MLAGTNSPSVFSLHPPVTGTWQKERLWPSVPLSLQWSLVRQSGRRQWSKVLGREIGIKTDQRAIFIMFHSLEQQGPGYTHESSCTGEKHCAGWSISATLFLIKKDSSLPCLSFYIKLDMKSDLLSLLLWTLMTAYHWETFCLGLGERAEAKNSLHSLKYTEKCSRNSLAAAAARPMHATVWEQSPRPRRRAKELGIERGTATAGEWWCRLRCAGYSDGYIQASRIYLLLVWTIIDLCLAACHGISSR